LPRRPPFFEKKGAKKLVTSFEKEVTKKTLCQITKIITSIIAETVMDVFSIFSPLRKFLRVWNLF